MPNFIVFQTPAWFKCGIYEEAANRGVLQVNSSAPARKLKLDKLLARTHASIFAKRP